MKTKTIRPTKARSQGELLPHVDKLREYNEFEDFHTKRSNGTDTRFKDTTVKTINLNGNWVETILTLENMSSWKMTKTGTIQIGLNVESTKSKAGETIKLQIGNSIFTAVTNSQGVATFSYNPTHSGLVSFVASYSGNGRKGFKAASDLHDSFTVDKMGVTVEMPGEIVLEWGDTFPIDPVIFDEDDNLINEGNIQFNYGSYTIDTEPVVDGHAHFSRTLNEPVTHTYWLYYMGTDAYESATFNFTLTATRWPTYLYPMHLSYDVVPGVATPIKVNVRNKYGDAITEGFVQLVYNPDANTEQVLYTEELGNDGSVTFQFVSDFVGSRDVKAKYLDSTLYKSSTKTITINSAKISTVLYPLHLTYDAYVTEPVSIKVNVRDGDGGNITSGSVRLKDGNTVLSTQSVGNDASVTFQYTPDTTGTKTLTVEYVENTSYTSSTRNITVNTTKIPTTTTITLHDIYDYPDEDNKFQVVVKDHNDNIVNAGTLNLIFEQANINESEEVGSFNLADTTGNLSLNRKNLNLDTLFDTIKGRKYLYYTGYKVHANYDGTSIYESSTNTKQPVNFHVRKSGIYLLPLIKDTDSYNIASDYPEIPSSLYGGYNIRVDHDDENGIISTVVISNNIYNGGINNPAQLGTVKKGQTIYFAIEYKALVIKDADKTKRESQIGNVQLINMGGLGTELHYKINNSSETDTANAYINGSNSKYTMPVYYKFTVPNTCQVGDIITLIFYISNNAGYYHYLEGTNSSEFGYRFMIQYEVVD